jgi:hypothetical protein
MKTAAATPAFILGFLVLLLSTGCSSAPKVPPETITRRNQAAAIAKLGDEALIQGKGSEAIQLYTLSLAQNRAVDNGEGEIQSLIALGNAWRFQGDY